MTSTDEPDGTAPAEEVHDYFRRIEEIFLRLRGAPLLLSPADWQVARRWHAEGVPLDLIEETLEAVFARRRERGAKGRVGSLRYCAPAVEAAWARLQEVRGPRAPAEGGGLDVPARLEALAAAVPDAFPEAEGWRRRILALAGGVPEAVEEGLEALDRELLEAAAAALDEQGRERLAQRLERALRHLPDRLPADERRRAESALRRRLLRQQADLPLLTLFH